MFGAAALAPAQADAAGLYFSERGVRPLARAGAFIAGADDLGAVFHNPAGVYESGSQFLLDFSWLQFTSDFQRQALVRQVDPNTGETIGTFKQNFRAVEGTSPVVPIPTIVGSFAIDEDWVLALGAFAPYAALTSYPDELDGQPAPQRYSLITLDGSALVLVGVTAGWAPNDWLRLGLGLGVLTGAFNSSVVLSGCVPERFFCAAEDPDWDVLSELTVGPIVAPTGNMGAIFLLPNGFRLGTSFQFPTFVRAGGSIKTRLPSAPVFSGATQDGEDVDVSFDLPWSARVGIETRDLIENLRVELAFVFDAWSMHDSIRVEPDGVALRDVTGFPERYYVPDIVFPRNFQDSMAVRLGGEYRFPFLGEEWDARGGVAYETSAIPPEYLHVLTIDMPKWTLALGLGLHIDKWRFDMTYAHVFGDEVVVDPADAKINQVSPVDANPPRNPTAINGGIYDSRANVFGVGLTYTFEPPPREAAKLRAEEEESIDPEDVETDEAPDEEPAAPTEDDEDDAEPAE